MTSGGAGPSPPSRFVAAFTSRQRGLNPGTIEFGPMAWSGARYPRTARLPGITATGQTSANLKPNEFSGRVGSPDLPVARSDQSSEGWRGRPMSQRVMAHVARSRMFGKSPVGAYLRVNEWIWRRLPEPMTVSKLATAYGRWAHALVRLHGDRRQYLGTFFLRNRPQLRLICRLADLGARHHVVRIAVLGASLGAEVYSVVWSIRSMHPDLRVLLSAVDVSEEVLAAAREGVYSPGVSDLVKEPILERMTEDEMRGMFDREGDLFRVKSRISEGIGWRLGDARDPRIVDLLGRQDVVLANDFLCHMEPPEAEGCLRNIARLVDPGGYLVVSGIDLDVRTKVAQALRWNPIEDSIEEIHNGDRSLRLSWPWKYWGLEPLEKSRPDWNVRYASVFQL